jgi:dethiobiotin synthetase
MPRVVVLGTGTGVGKTYVTAALARALVAATRGPVLAVKPVETGIVRRRNGAPPAGSDADQLERVSRAPALRPHPLYALREPVSAHLAARRETLRISVRAILQWINSTTIPDTTYGAMASWTLIETAGGALSPLTTGVTNAHLARRLDPAIWVLVAPDSLGVFHDLRATLLGLDAIARAPDYVVLSQARPRDAATGLNAGEFRRLGLPRPIAVVGRGKDPDAALAPLVQAIRRRRTATRSTGH